MAVSKRLNFQGLSWLILLFLNMVITLSIATLPGGKGLGLALIPWLAELWLWREYVRARERQTVMNLLKGKKVEKVVING